MSTDICYVISHGFAARMLFQTGLIAKLADQGFNIAIICPDAKDENWKAFDGNKNITVYESEEHNNIWDDDYSFKRKYFLEDIKKNSALWEKHIHSLFYSKSKHPWKRIRPLYYYCFYFLIKYFPSIRERFVERENKYLVSQKLNNLIQKIDPALVVSTYPVSLLEAKILFAAQQKEIPTITHLLSWDNITSKGKFPVTSDYFITWGAIMTQELKEYYEVEDKNVYQCGVPHFDHHIKLKPEQNFKDKISELGLNANQPYLFVAMSAPRFCPGEMDIVEWMILQIEKEAWGNEMQLVIRPHPQIMQGAMKNNSWVSRLKKINNPKVAVDFPRLVKSKIKWSMQREDMNHLSNLLLGCSICINSGSTVSIDALMVDKPVILTSFDGDRKLPYWKSARRLIDYTHLAKLVKLGGVRVSTSYEDFNNQINSFLQDPELDWRKRKDTIEQQCFSQDGRSTNRVIKVMNSISKRILGTVIKE